MFFDHFNKNVMNKRTLVIVCGLIFLLNPKTWIFWILLAVMGTKLRKVNKIKNKKSLSSAEKINVVASVINLITALIMLYIALGASPLAIFYYISSIWIMQTLRIVVISLSSTAIVLSSYNIFRIIYSSLIKQEKCNTKKS